ncbi:MerR family transcriptional regulator [Schnuerera sp. xch1]|uniref:MerR family transcriptional regulator n=1 Tax=Schnuerera sp. xch1 TaxID=2874283 RepID=UPI001CC0A94E|nr:MerR family transcriptional regulator [Schnuerera sp. xch1]MBZ2174271.1 MerR family transcriptional regulator [Schnuerera sp. xch1]
MGKERKFSIGEIAKLTGVTIRTLQYYDNIGLVPLKRETTNGHRYYRKSDLTRLQQVLFYKSLGLPIKKIQEIIVKAVTNKQITAVLEKQRDIFYHKLNDLKMNISLIDACLANIEGNKSFPIGKLVQLMISLNKGSIFEYKNVNFSEDINNIFMNHYENTEEIIEIYWNWKLLIVEAVSHILNNVNPKSEQGRKFARKWINMISQITDEDPELLEAHKTSYKNRTQWPEEDRRLMEFANKFIDEAVKYYLSNFNDEGGEK